MKKKMSSRQLTEKLLLNKLLAAVGVIENRALHYLIQRVEKFFHRLDAKIS